MKPEDSYYNQRRDRLSDVVGDYLTDESLTPQDFYRDLMAEVQSWIDYHEKELKRTSEVKSLLKGEDDFRNFKLELIDSKGKNFNITGINSATPRDWNEFWYSPEAQGGWGNNLSALDAELAQKKSEYYFDFDRNKDYLKDEDC